MGQSRVQGSGLVSSHRDSSAAIGMQQDQPDGEVVQADPAQASRALVARIVQLYVSGRTPEEIATHILTDDPENVKFRTAVLVETIIDHALGCPRERSR